MMERIIIYSVIAVIAVTILVINIIRFRCRQRRDLARLTDAKIGFPMAQHPQINESLCVGCGSCVAACPEGDVLGIVYGKAKMLNPLRCVGHGACASACPVGAISIGLGDVSRRSDLPMLDDAYQTNIPGIYIAGELGGLSLVHNAVNQGKKIVEYISASPVRTDDPRVKDVVIVGAGPAGLSAALSALEHNLSYLVLEQYAIGGAILQFPKRKMVMVQPVKFPVVGKLHDAEYSKEELLYIWQKISHAYKLNILTGQRVQRIERYKGIFKIETGDNTVFARNIVLALGRRGTPKKLDVPGEDLPKVTYQLEDAQSYQHKNILIVGGGDSAIETAIALARQPGNKVGISYRKHKFLRIKKRNLEQLDALIRQGKIYPFFKSTVVEITEKSVRLRTAKKRVEKFPNDYVFIMIGGTPPFEMLKEMGIAFGGEKLASLDMQPQPQFKKAG